MLINLVLLTGLLGAVGPSSPPENPAVEVRFVRRDLIAVRSTRPIRSIHLAEPALRFGYYTELSPDHRAASVHVRSGCKRMTLTVETGAPGTIAQRREFSLVVPIRLQRHAERGEAPISLVDPPVMRR